MTRKSRRKSTDEPDQKKKRLADFKKTDASSIPKPERNILNDSLLSLYKRELAEKVPKSVISAESGGPNSSDTNPSTSENLSKTDSAPEASKTPSRALKRGLKKAFVLKNSSVTFSDVGGLEKELKYVLRLFLHLKLRNLLKKAGVDPVRGFLLHGPPGCGKTLLVNAIAGQLKLPFMEVAATELVCGISGESESKIRDLFEEAVRCAPCILFIDEIDSISPKRDTSDRGMERRMVTQLLKSFDELNSAMAEVMVIGSTNRIDSIDPALRRGGRFDHEIAIGMPDENARLKILQILCKKLQLAPDCNLHSLAKITPGYVGADLKTIVTDAMELAVCRVFQEVISSNKQDKSMESNELDTTATSEINLKTPQPYTSDGYLDSISLEEALSWYESDTTLTEDEHELYFQFQDFEIAVRNCIPYSKREGFATVPDVTWDDVGALDDVREQVQAAILWPVKHRVLYEEFHIASTKGILLCGPKGCGKTLLAKAVANECSINFLSVKGPELLSMYLGESEKAVRQCFQRARNSAPCVIFFDEIDALCPSRSASNVNAAAERVVNQLLTEMDGMEERKQVFVMAATNRPERIDSAMLRPGRLEKIIFVDLPSPEDRVEILKSITKNKTRPKVDDSLSLESIGQDGRCQGFSGADLAYLVREASNKAMKDYLSKASIADQETLKICSAHFEHAFAVVKPSVSERDSRHFRENYMKMFGR